MTTTTTPDHSITALGGFAARMSSDIVKSDLELTCDDCGQIVCDIEDGDNLLVLLQVAMDHLDECDPSVPDDEDVLV